MCIQYTKTIRYRCDHCEDANGEFIECDGVENGECTGVEEEPAPSERNRGPNCEAAAAAAAAASNEPESEATSESQEERAGQGEAIQ